MNREIYRQRYIQGETHREIHKDSRERGRQGAGYRQTDTDIQRQTDSETDRETD